MGPEEAHVIDQAEAWAIDTLRTLVEEQVEFYMNRGAWPTSSLLSTRQTIERVGNMEVSELQTLVHCAVAQLAGVAIMQKQMLGELPLFGESHEG